MGQLNNEETVSKAFSKQAPIFDTIDNSNSIITWMRGRVRAEVLMHLPDETNMLELNCGTGIDSIFFAQNGCHVTATDNAEGMLMVLDEKISTLSLENSIKTKRCSFNELTKLSGNSYNYIFSNFGGLNCTNTLDKVLKDIDGLLKPGGYFTLVIMPKVCPWEIITLFKGYFKTAFRRFKKDGTKANVEGVKFDCYYYTPDYVIKNMNQYELVSLKGLSIVVPPPFIENFIERYPRLFSRLEKIENKIYQSAPYNRWCDHYMITMRKQY